MENASKALIIAGAILLSILLITLGIMVYRQAAGVMDKNAMDETAVTTFNEKFLQYEGDNVRGTQVNSLIDTIIQNNLSNEGDSSKQIEFMQWFSNAEHIWSGKNSNEPRVIKSREDSGKALTGKSYKVKCHINPKSGYVYKIELNIPPA